MSTYEPKKAGFPLKMAGLTYESVNFRSRERTECQAPPVRKPLFSWSSRRDLDAIFTFLPPETDFSASRLGSAHTHGIETCLVAIERRLYIATKPIAVDEPPGPFPHLETKLDEA